MMRRCRIIKERPLLRFDIVLVGKRNAEIEGVIMRDNGEVCARSRGDFTILSSKLAVRLGIITDEQLQNFFEPLFQQIPGNHD